MASQSNQPTHSERILTDEAAHSANSFSTLPIQLQDEYQSYNESSDEFSEDDNEPSALFKLHSFLLHLTLHLAHSLFLPKTIRRIHP